MTTITSLLSITGALFALGLSAAPAATQERDGCRHAPAARDHSAWLVAPGSLRPDATTGGAYRGLLDVSCASNPLDVEWVSGKGE